MNGDIFQLEIFGRGFELVAGKINQKKYNFWKNKTLPETTNPKDKSLYLYDHWTDLNNIYHDSGPEFSDRTLLTISKNHKQIFKTYLGIDDLKKEKLKVSKENIAVKEKYYFLGYQYESGTFYDAEFEAKKFDLAKLLIKVENLEEYLIISDVIYDGEEIEKGDYNTTTKEINLKVYKKN